MDSDFINAWKEIRNNYRCDWISWLGSPMLYDGGLYVNRSKEEIAEHTRRMTK